ncbi:MAG: hypothetical protein Q8P44_08490 [Dehalococcoidia bacterium]|nr:hypothetical protein [Dehalococcoidia bacterium]
MGKGDFRWREQKKAKKSAKKGLGEISLSETQTVVEVIRTKGKKEQPPEELD